MNQAIDYDAIFAGIIGQEYEMLKLICPLMTEMSRLVGQSLAVYPSASDMLSVVELGGGTGITTLALLTAREDCRILSIDNEPTMQNQAKSSLKAWQESGRLDFCGEDALTALRTLADNSTDVVASAYTLHNFADSYRKSVILETFRILKPGGLFVNGDRYALDNIDHHTRITQQEVSGYFKVLTKINRLDLLEHWIVHLFSDESENHVMRESRALEQMQAAGFSDIRLDHRMEVNALVSGIKPNQH